MYWNEAKLFLGITFSVFGVSAATTSVADPTVDVSISIIVSCIIALASAIALLFKMIVQQKTENADIRESLGELRGKQDAIENYAKEVLLVVHHAAADKKENKKDLG